MKKELLALLLVLCGMGISAYAQIELDTICWIKVDDSSLQALEGGESFSGNDTLNGLLSNYNVNHYEQALPFAQSELLQKIIEIRCQCDIDSLYYDLVTHFGTRFYDYNKHEVAEEEITLYNPADQMWSNTLQNPNDWLWHLKKIQADLAWDITKGDPSVRMAIIDFDIDISHPDLAGKLVTDYDPHDLEMYGCDPWHYHGTSVAGFAGAETTEQGSTPSGTYASAGFKSKIVFYNIRNYKGITREIVLAKALHASNVMGIKTITSCAGKGIECNSDPNSDEDVIVKEILDNGTSIIMPAGNGIYPYQCEAGPNDVYPFYPFSPIYDERVIVVSSTGKDDKHQYIDGNGDEKTHSHYPEVDVCAPGYDVLSMVKSQCGSVSWPYQGDHGTSLSSPLVAGVASLMYSVNPCMSPALCQDILKNTADPILDAANYPGQVGSGRINAYKAVVEAERAHSTTLDLYIKDRNEDFGDEQNPYSIMADRDDSPDIWVRNQPDGFTNREHQQPEYQTLTPIYIYVRVRNKSCVASTGNEQLSLYWSKASSWASWPQNWDGSQDSIGDLIGTQNIGVLETGREKIFVFSWNIPDPYAYENWSSCLLARIENSSIDDITLYPGRLDNEVYYNNNIAMRNLTIVDEYLGIMAPGVINGAFFPHGGYVLIGNPTENTNRVDIKFSVDPAYPSVVEDAEVKLIFDAAGWNFFGTYFENADGVQVLAEREVLLTEDEVVIEDVEIPSETRFPVYVGFSFLADEISGDNQYKYHIRQFFHGDSIPLGGEHVLINFEDRPGFDAEAGDDVELFKGDSTQLSALSIGAPALYNWYNQQNVLVHQGQSHYVTPDASETYMLEVISTSDGVKDYDDVTVTVKKYGIRGMSPNPATTSLTVEYKADDATTAYLAIVNQSATVYKQYSLNTQQVSVTLDINELDPGMYSVLLFCDGQEYDAKSLIVQ